MWSWQQQVQHECKTNVGEAGFVNSNRPQWVQFKLVDASLGQRYVIPSLPQWPESAVPTGWARVVRQ